MNNKRAEDIKLKAKSIHCYIDVEVVKSERVINSEVVITLPSLKINWLNQLIEIADFHEISIEASSKVKGYIQFVIF